MAESDVLKLAYAEAVGRRFYAGQTNSENHRTNRKLECRTAVTVASSDGASYSERF